MAALGVIGFLGTFLGLSLARKYRAESPELKRKLLILVSTVWIHNCCNVLWTRRKCPTLPRLPRAAVFYTAN